jgi:hypothetical protein
VDLRTGIASHLHDLVDNLEVGSNSSLSEAMTALAQGLHTAVSSYLGCQLTLVLDGWPVTLTAFGDLDGAGPNTSLRLALSSIGPGFDAESRIVFYAGTPGSFVDLAADLAYLQLLHRPENAEPSNRDGHQPTVALDADLPPVSVVSGLSGLTKYVTINRAVGALIQRGRALDDARVELRRTAAILGMDLPDYAARVIQE